MGHHYVPQKYLRGFSAPDKPDFIWMHDKKLGTCKLLPIRQVAQEAGFYTDDVEFALNEYVEKPANVVLDRIRKGGDVTLSEAERAHLSVYVVTMLKRVPRHRDLAYQQAPRVLAETVREIKEHIEGLGREGRLDPATVGKRLAEADAAELRYSEEPPPNVVEVIETPWPAEVQLNVIFSMEWRFILAGGQRCFLTSDNPAYFFAAFGLDTQHAELVFPLSSILALHCSWQPNRVPGLLRAQPRAVDEFNNRVASGATRFIFYRASAEWVLKAGNVPIERLNRINW